MRGNIENLFYCIYLLVSSSSHTFLLSFSPSPPCLTSFLPSLLPLPHSSSSLSSSSSLHPFHPSLCTLSDIAEKENCVVTPAEIKEQLDVLIVQERTEPAPYVIHVCLAISPTFFNLTFSCLIS
jgi:hypothetical protein